MNSDLFPGTKPKEIRAIAVRRKAGIACAHKLDGPEQISFALERAIGTIMTRVYKLRQQGLMPRPVRAIRHPRMRSAPGCFRD